jgi:hypothetical protein
VPNTPFGVQNSGSDQFRIENLPDVWDSDSKASIMNLFNVAPFRLKVF